jgi:hydroxymethylglutaryl-CoA synthase
MSGIRAYGAYIPATRLPLALIQGRPAKEGGPEKAVAYDDEDSVTMAVAAAVDCLRGIDRAEVDSVMFASTTYSMKEKQAAAIVAKALDLRRDVLTMDFSGSLRSGTSALEAAVHAVKAGGSKNVLVVASDCRMGAPRGALEAKLGDAAAAFLISNDSSIAGFSGAYAVSDELQDMWRVDGETFTHAWEDRFIVQEGYTPTMAEALAGLLERTGTGPGDYARAALVGPDARSLGGVARKAGFDPEKLQDPLFGRLGHSGASFGPVLLAAALEGAKSGEKILVAASGDGAHAMAFSVTDRIGSLPPRRGVKGHLERRRPLPSYDTYLKARNLDPREWDSGADLGLSATIRFRERDTDIGLVGARCTQCGQVHLPRPRVCYGCFAKDQWEPHRLSDKEGKVLSYTFDFFFPTAQPPTIMIMTEVDGCRVQVQLANAKPDEVRLDMPVEYVFRKIHNAGGKANYFWKASPLPPGA